MKKKLLPVLGTIALSLTFFYYVVWPPIIRTTCAQDSKEIAKGMNYPETESGYNKAVTRYGQEYLMCVNRHGLAD